jgi:hypothetical protein
MQLQCDEIRSQVFHGADYFSCMAALRRSLEERSQQLLCNGARTNAVASRMSRSMGLGRKVYLLTLGKQAQLDDLVDIFGYAPPDTVSSVEDQKNFYSIWLDSLSKK